MQIFSNVRYDFLRWRWHALAVSAVVIATGAAVVTSSGLAMGVEFAGGSVVITQFEQPTTIQQVRSALGETFGGQLIVQTYGDPSQRQVMVRVPQVGQEAGRELSTTADAVVSALRQANLGNFEIVGSEIVGPAVGRELTSKGFWATVLSLGGILLYLTFRYRLSFATGAVVATIHDLLVVFACLAVFRYEITLNVIAAILTVAGYSSNDTIVVFDRVRENLRSMRRDSIKDVINLSVNQTLGRTVITSGTTLLSALALFLFGGELLRGFAFTLIVGVITGTYSTVFIAGSVVTLWHGAGSARRRVPVQAASAEPPQAPVRKTKPTRKARAS
jgi:preprotein translocase subunit SecF